MPSATAAISRAPRRNSGWRHRAGAAAEDSVMHGLSYGTVDAPLLHERARGQRLRTLPEPAIVRWTVGSPL